MKPIWAVVAAIAAVVAPRAGAWIETTMLLIKSGSVLVAPRAGAWIETEQGRLEGLCHSPSHPARVRGLKLKKLYSNFKLLNCRTPRGCVD